MTFTAVRPAWSLAIEPSPYLYGVHVAPMLMPRQQSRRAASISVAMSASLKAIAWWRMIGTPNVSRCIAYSTDCSKAARAMPTAWMPTMGRVASNVDSAPERDFFALSGFLAPSILALSLSSPPSSCSSGTNTSSSASSAVWDARMPSLRVFLVWLKPSMSEVTRNDACPRWPSWGSTVATTMWTSAMPPLVIQIFSPLSSQPPSTFSARVRMRDTSEPAPGSDTQYAPTLTSSGVPKMRGAHSAICSPVPVVASPASANPDPRIASPMPAHPHDSSSMMSAEVRPVASWPVIV